MPRRVRNPATLSYAYNSTENVVRIQSGDTLFQLREPIDLDVRQEREHWLVGYESIGVEGYGDTLDEALESFADQFRGTWFAIVKEDDSRLTRDAQALKRAMLKLISAVEE